MFVTPVSQSSKSEYQIQISSALRFPSATPLCYFAKTAIADAGFRDPPALEAAMDAVLDVHERVIGIFIADIEVGSRAYNFNVVWVKTIDPRD